MLVVFYPGFIDSHTTNATGPALTNGIALSETSFTIQARDTEANYRYNGGADTFTLALTGITDWAGAGRTDEVTSGIPHTIPLAQASREWTLLCTGCANATLGSYYIDVTTDLRPHLKRGDQFVIGNGKRYGERFQVHLQNDYTSTMIPMDSKYMSTNTLSQNLYKVGPTSGTHEVKFTPKVRGSYRLDVIVPATNEIQSITTSGISQLGGSFQLIYDGEYTEDINFDVSPSDLQAEIEALTTFNYTGVTVSLISNNAYGGKTWEVTFATGEQSIHLLSENSAKLTGSGARTVIASMQPGVPARHIVGSPFSVLVAPEETDPTMTIAYGKGLVDGEAGKMSTFTIQSKDTWGNNRWENQTHDVYRVDVYKPKAYVGTEVDDGPEHSQSTYHDLGWLPSRYVESIRGDVKYMVDGTYNCSFTPDGLWQIYYCCYKRHGI